MLCHDLPLPRTVTPLAVRTRSTLGWTPRSLATVSLSIAKGWQRDNGSSFTRPPTPPLSLSLLSASLSSILYPCLHVISVVLHKSLLPVSGSQGRAGILKTDEALRSGREGTAQHWAGHVFFPKCLRLPCPLPRKEIWGGGHMNA